MKVLLHADGGVGVGLGHVSRCAAISTALARAGHQALVVVDPERKLLEHVVRQGANGKDCGASAPDVREAALAFWADCVVIDSYRWIAADFRAVRGHWAVAAFDDEAVRELPVDAVINGAPAAVELHYQTVANTRLWLGPAYQIVRDDFRLMPPREHIGAVKRVIALVGGDDPLGLLPVLARLLDTVAASSSFVADVICGPFTPMPEIPGLRHVTILRNPTDLRDRMAGADLAISASGQTLYELARCGTPTIAFCSGPDQIHNLTALAKANIIWNVGDAASPCWARDVDAAITKLIGDVGLRTAMSQAGQALIDGLGAERLVSALESLRIEPLNSIKYSDFISKVTKFY
jgi:spore coat polysaccharide biosynthesis predicted glycosyltransferase SpsG